MKKILIMIMAMGLAFGAVASNPLGSLLGGLGGKGGDDGGKSALGSALGGLVSGLLTTDKVSPDKMVGTWRYSAPAVCFKSENFLQKAGGSAAAGTIEGKLAPVYAKSGLDKLVLVVKEDHTFEMKVGKMVAKGTIETDGEGNVDFNFKALGKVKMGKMRAYVTMTAGRTMSVMFDVSKLVGIIKGVGKVVNNSTINTTIKLLDSYDGICAGFKLTAAQ